MRHLFCRQSRRRYLLAIVFFLAPAFLLLALNAFILWQSGELQPVSRIAQKLQRGNYMFESGVHDLKRELNLELIRLRKPSIIAFGSSRPLNFRQEYFKDPYIFNCACMSVANLTDGIFYANKLLAIHKPDVVILSVDFWWFTTESGVRPKPLSQDMPPLTFQKLVKPMQLVADGTITFQQYRQLFHTGNDFTHTSAYEKDGLLGIIRGMGSRSDGSFLNGIRFTDYAQEYYKDWRNILHNPKTYISENDRYGSNKKILEKNVRDYATLVKKFQDQGVKVVSVMLPLAPAIYDALAESGNHKHIFEIADRISGYGDEFYDLQNPHPISSDMCEYEDAHHSGDIVFMRTLRKIVADRPDSALAPYIDNQLLDASIKAYAGRTVAPLGHNTIFAKERDFTGFGCAK